MENEVITREPQSNTPAKLLEIAINQGADLDRLEQLMALQERWEANQARKAYTDAMSAFKADPIEIEKDKHVKFKTNSGVTEYNHATLGNVVGKINSALSKYGLSAGWITKQDGAIVTVTCRITHVMGHSEETTLAAGIDSSGGKNSIQALGSTISYLERYTILALTGLATNDMDNDAAAPVEYITDQQKSTIVDMVNAKAVNEEKFLTYMGAESVDKILASDFNKAITSLRSAKGKA